MWGGLLGGGRGGIGWYVFLFFFLFFFFFLSYLVLTYLGIGVCRRRELGMLGSIRRDGKVFAGLFTF